MKKHALLLLPLLILTLFPLVAPPASARPLTPASTRPQREAAAARAIDWIHDQFLQGELIGVGACDAARVVALTGENPGAGRWVLDGDSLIQHCEQAFDDLPGKDVGDVAKVLRAALVAGKDPRHFANTDLIAFIQSRYDMTTGFYHPYNLFRNSLALIALEEAGQSIPEKAIAATIGDQNPDGCWGWPIGGDVTDTDTSGLVIYALSGAGRADTPAVNQCIGRLMAMQNDDGGWELSGIYGDEVSNVDSTALVVQGLTAAGWDPEGPTLTKNRSAAAALLAFQADDGSFWWRYDEPGSPLLGTEQAIQPLLMTYPNEIPKPISLYLPLAMR